MVLAEIGENTARKNGFPGPVLADGMGRDLHHAVRGAVGLHLRKNLHERRQRRRSISCAESAGKRIRLHCRYISAPSIWIGADELGKNPSASCLAVGSGDSPDSHGSGLNPSRRSTRRTAISPTLSIARRFRRSRTDRWKCLLWRRTCRTLPCTWA